MSVFARDTQVRITLPEARSVSVSTWSRWSGCPSSTVTAHAPHAPPRHMQGASTSACSRASSSVSSTLTAILRPLRARMTSNGLPPLRHEEMFGMHFPRSKAAPMRGFFHPFHKPFWSAEIDMGRNRLILQPVSKPDLGRQFGVHENPVLILIGQQYFKSRTFFRTAEMMQCIIRLERAQFFQIGKKRSDSNSRGKK